MTEIASVKIFWDFTLNPEGTTTANHTDTVVGDCNNKMPLLIDMIILAVCNISLKIFTKLSKYKDFVIEISKI